MPNSFVIADFSTLAARSALSIRYSMIRRGSNAPAGATFSFAASRIIAVGVGNTPHALARSSARRAAPCTARSCSGSRLLSSALAIRFIPATQITEVFDEFCFLLGGQIMLGESRNSTMPLLGTAARPRGHHKAGAFHEILIAHGVYLGECM